MNFYNTVRRHIAEDINRTLSQLCLKDRNPDSEINKTGCFSTHRKPPEFGGTGKDPVWGINTDDYQKALANTNIN